MSHITRAYCASRYGQLHYRIASPASPIAAPPLLCLHQTPSDGRDFVPVMPDLAQGRVVIAADNPGYGMSDAPPEPVRIEDFAEIMAQLTVDLAAAGVVPPGPFDVMGFHTGSVIATQLARSLPDRVRRAVLFGLAAYPPELRAQKLAELLENFPPPGDDLHHVEKLWALINDLSDPRIPMETRHTNMAECLRLGKRMPWGYISVYNYDFLGAIAEVAQPVLVMNPQDDLWEITTATADRYRNGTRYDLPGVKHGVMTLERDRVVAAIEAFLQSGAIPASGL